MGETLLSAAIMLGGNTLDPAYVLKMLDSIKALCDQIVVIDTGMDPKSRRLAEGYGAEIHEHPWENSFSLHRNQSLSYCRGDWVLIIDGDEEMEYPEGHGPATVREWLPKVDTRFNALVLDVLDMRDNERHEDTVFSRMNSPRLFRRGCVKYNNIVHNQPDIVGDEGQYFPWCRILHYGYGLSPEGMLLKHERTVGLLKKQIEEKQEGYLQAPLYLAESYGTMYQITGDQELGDAAIQWARLYLQNRDELGARFQGSIYQMAAAFLLFKGEDTEALAWITEGLSRYPKDPDLSMTLADFGVACGDPEMIASGSWNHIQGTKAYYKDPSILGNRFAFKTRMDYVALSLHRYALVRLWQAMRAFRDYGKMRHHMSQRAQYKCDEEVKAKLAEAKYNLVDLTAGPDESALTDAFGWMGEGQTEAA